MVPGFALLTALGAFVWVPLPPFGVPQTLQTLMVLLCALALGPRLGAASMGLYVVAGVVGVPLFAQGEAGWVTIFGQTGGYLVGFVLCQTVAHAVIRRRDGSLRGWGAVVVAGLAVHAVVFACGVPWLYVVRNLDPQAAPITLGDAVFGGFVVFIPGTLIKVAMATLLARMLLPAVAARVW
jgi:biotin transport system substrate-specific component